MKNKIVVMLFLFMMVLYSNVQVHSESDESIYIQINLWSNELIVIKNNQVIRRYPISPGLEQTPTPIGTFKVREKSKSWGGGFGTRWLGLNVPWGSYGIHGTNKPHLIGKSVSSGCIRMRNEDVEALFDIIPNGTIVHIDGPVTGMGKGEYKSLSLGSKGNLVQLVQNRLKAIGLFHGTVNGIYDKQTENAVKKFQKIHDMPITGAITQREYMLLGILE